MLMYVIHLINVKTGKGEFSFYVKVSATFYFIFPPSTKQVPA